MTLSLVIGSKNTLRISIYKIKDVMNLQQIQYINII